MNGDRPTPLAYTSGKLPLPIIGRIQHYAKLHHMMAAFGFKAHAYTNGYSDEHLLGNSQIFLLLKSIDFHCIG